MDKLQEMVWKVDYETGIRVIDSQHQKLFGLYNAMVNHLKSHGSSGVSAMINDLIAYAEQHFTYEEKLMDKYLYPDRVNHAKEHSEFIDKVMELTVANLEGAGSDAVQRFANFLQDWLINHIMVTDREYIPSILGGE